MKTLSFNYIARIEFDEEVTNHSFTVKSMPQTDERQQVISSDIRILPNEFLSEGRDSFDNVYYYGRTMPAHNLFEVVTSGIVQTGLSDSVHSAKDYQLGMYRAQTQVTKPGDELKSFYASLDLSGADNDLDKARAIMAAIREVFNYETGSTIITTTAEEAFAQKKGVCQDYSHIMLCLCRLAGIHARYVAGMLIGEGASHAWVEIYHDEHWYGLDPTNGTEVFDEHIKISHGRDYTDCLITQGVFNGGARQSQLISVTVNECD